ncbi:hypothetical protein JCM3765_000740 [Sporobolomyces pararoseus]
MHERRYVTLLYSPPDLIYSGVANMVAGHTLLKILSGMLWPILTSGVVMFFVALLPMAIFLALVGLEIAVSFIQAYVFVVLTCVYLRDAIDLH